jgi:mRNA-degrading endonuclease toxin of MazEF toxin-antitoxin module
MFELWHKLKEKLHISLSRKLFNERDIYWCSMGLNVGDEENGKGASYVRPVLIIRKFNRDLFLGVPLSTQIKEKWYYKQITFNGKTQSVMISQIKCLSAKRLFKYLGKLDDKDFKYIQEEIVNMVREGRK